ncbi:response regulator [Streptomyces sp. HNM0574]|uniref:response regulator n=1 Tax=Streptomyces sp. HNM0574 TaxID=2714954 RepID=UPI00146ED3E6|nr:response regulator [Streptomyces sp. HNM0574]NLU69820.1 response regulator [Streptomyces sp. HNM0574]
MTTPLPSPSGGSSILIVDDAEENLAALEAVLGPLGQRVVSARSGEEALKAMLRQDFAVALIDVLMPGMDGFETVGNIKRLDQTKDVPVILVTGADVDTDYAYRGYALGVADFLAKPIDPWVLRTKVTVFLELHRKNRQLAAQAEQLRRLLITGPAADDGTTAEAAPAEPRAATPPGEERLTEIVEKLGQIKDLLREAEGYEPPGLADRLADMERLVRALGTGE